MSINFAKKYRPQTFEEVVGQKHPVTILSKLIQPRKIGRSILLHGAVGSGKTSLARLYGKALNCLEPTQTGSPCNECLHCTTNGGRGVGFKEYDVSGKGGDKENILQWLKQNNRKPLDCDFGVLFLDEVHSLTRDASDALLKAVEEPEENVLFLFATTEFHNVRPALRSRLLHLEVRPLPPMVAVNHLEDIGRREGMDCEREALALLVGLKDGYPRDLLLGLEQLYHLGGRVTVERVRELFDVDHAAVLVDYFCALGDGDLQRQTKLMFDWQETAVDKVRWVQTFLTTLYYNDILFLPMVVNAVTHSIRINERAPILDRFLARLQLTDRADLVGPWRRMLDFWSMPIGETDDASAMLRFALFHHLVNDELPDPERDHEVSRPKRTTRAQTQATGVTSAGFPPRQPLPANVAIAPTKEDRGSGFLGAEDVRTIVNCASFLTQEHGVLFNAAITLRPDRFGTGHEDLHRQLASEFWAELEDKACRDGHDRFARLSVFERDRDGFFCLGAMHLSQTAASRDDANSSVMTWIRDWGQGRRAGKSRDAIMVDPAPRSRQEALKFHWNVTLGLCAGLGNGIEDWDPEQERMRPLRELLGIPKRMQREASRVRGGPLVQTSSLLTPDAIAEASRDRMEPLSAFDARAWNCVRTGWERDEHPDRIRVSEGRHAEIEEILYMHGSDEAKALEAVRQHVECWPEDPQLRQRAWRGWWPAPEQV